MRSNYFPAEIENCILENLSLKELARVSIVSKSYHSLFFTKREDTKKQVFTELRNASICKEITLPELEAKLVPHLNVLSKEDKKNLFLLLKRIEKKIFTYTANSLIRDKSLLKITWDDMRAYLTKQFGIAAQFHAKSFECVLGHNGVESRAKEFARFAALEIALNQNKDPDALRLLNAYFKQLKKADETFAIKFILKTHYFRKELKIKIQEDYYSVADLKKHALATCHLRCEEQVFNKTAAETEQKLLDDLYGNNPVSINDKSNCTIL